MKKVFIYIVIVALLAGCSVESIEPESESEKNNNEPEVIIQKEEFKPRTVKASYLNIEITRLNVRSTPDEDGDNIVARVFENEKYQIEETALDSQSRLWYKIEYEPGAYGYVAGWFCVETEITVFVEEEETSITDIVVYPVPSYLDNPFDERKAEIGDQVVKLIIKEIAELEELNKIAFSGEVELTGTYYHEKEDDGNQIRFVPDEASSPLLPRISEDIGSVWFILDDYSTIATEFGEVDSSGLATVIIEGYTIYYGADTSGNKATLVNVILN